VKNLTAIKIKSREVVLSWILPDNGNSAITEYILHKALFQIFQIKSNYIKKHFLEAEGFSANKKGQFLYLFNFKT